MNWIWIAALVVVGAVLLGMAVTSGGVTLRTGLGLHFARSVRAEP